MKLVPHRQYYEWQSFVARVGEILLYTVAALSLVKFAIDYDSTFKSLFPVGIARLLDCSITFISVTYLLADIIQGYIFFMAERCRVLDFLDNSLGSKFSHRNSEGYFSNDNIPVGVFKMGVNGFENAFFTMSVTEVMLRGILVKGLILFFLFLGIFVTESSSLFSVIAQSALVASIIWNGIKLVILHQRTTQIFNDYKIIFATALTPDVDSLIIKNVLLYDKTLSWAGVILHVNVFQNLNSELSVQWEKIKLAHLSS
jgi:hypothetical protein